MLCQGTAGTGPVLWPCLFFAPAFPLIPLRHLGAWTTPHVTTTLPLNPDSDPEIKPRAQWHSQDDICPHSPISSAVMTHGPSAVTMVGHSRQRPTRLKPDETLEMTAGVVPWPQSYSQERADASLGPHPQVPSADQGGGELKIPFHSVSPMYKASLPSWAGEVLG